MSLVKTATSADEEQQPVEFGRSLTFRVSEVSAGDVHGLFFESFPDGWFNTVRQIVGSLVNERMFMGYQLSYAKGLIDQDEYRSIAADFLRLPSVVPDLEHKALVLAELVPELVDAELVSSVFHCDVGDAERALNRAAKQLRFSFAGYPDSLRQAIAEQSSDPR